MCSIEGDLDRLSTLLHEDHELVDHRTFGWPRLERDDVLAMVGRGEDEGVLVVAERLDADGDACLARVALWETEPDGASTQGVVAFTVAHIVDGSIRTNEFFDDVEIARAHLGALGHRARTDVAVLDERHRLERVEGGGFELTVVDDAGRVIETVRYPAEEEAAARRDVTARWFGGLGEARQRVGQLAVALGEAWVAPSTHAFDDLLTADFQLVDARTLGMGSSDRAAFEEALRGREADGTTGPPVPSRVTFVSDDVMVFRASNLGHAPDSGVDWEEVACNVLVVDGDRIARLEMFDEDHWDDAITRARELTGDGAAMTETNGMVAWIERTLTGDGRFLAGLADFSPDIVRIDRRSAVSAEPADRAGFLESIRTRAEMGSRYDARPLAIRDDRLALFEITVDAGDQPVEMLVVGELDVEGRLRGVVQFDPNDLAAAQDELDRRYSSMLTDEAAATLEPGLRFRSAMSSTGTSEMSDVLAQGFVAVDHRAMAFPDLDRDGFLEINQQRDELFGEALVFTTEIHRIEGDVIVASNRMAGLTPDSGVEWLHEFVNIFIVRGGRLHGLENFGPDALDAAMARADELVGARSRPRRPVPQVQRLGQDVVDATATGDFAAVRTCFEEDFVRIDRRRMIGLPDMDRDEYVADLQRQWKLGWRDYRTVAVQAVRPNGFVALFTTDFDGGSESPFGALLVEGATGRIGRLVLYDADDMRSAFEELDEAWLATLGPADAETYRTARDQYSAYVGLDRDRFEELTAPGFVFTDQRRLGNFGQLDRAGFVDLFAARRDTLGPGSARVTAVHSVDRSVVVFSKEELTRTVRYGAETTNTGIHVVRVTEETVDLGEIYDDAELSAALTRAEELADGNALESGRLLENGATRWVRAVFAGGGSVDVDAFADDFVCEDRRSTVAAEAADRHAFAESLRAQHQTGAVRWSEVVAVRGDRFGLCRLTSRDDGSQADVLAVVELDDAGRALRMWHFDGDDVSAAMDHLSRSWASTLPRELLGPLRLAAEYERAGYTAGLDGGSFFADDVVIVDHRSVGLGESDLSGYLRMHGRRADDGPVTGFAPEVVPMSPNVLLFSNVNTIEAGDGASWEEFYFQLFVARDGKIARLELFAEDQRDVAFRRARELAES
ncbi:hypothetical protein, partial [Ilumatobacter sp.]|uniref:hypothetical protein n=1 Tax=Ilumatobacter sp. TaxID=1967498 RepID=UPI003AF99DFD